MIRPARGKRRSKPSHPSVITRKKMHPCPACRRWVAKRCVSGHGSSWTRPRPHPCQPPPSAHSYDLSVHFLRRNHILLTHTRDGTRARPRKRFDQSWGIKFQQGATFKLKAWPRSQVVQNGVGSLCAFFLRVRCITIPSTQPAPDPLHTPASSLCPSATHRHLVITKSRERAARRRRRS